jgi:hypothetical protein
MNLSGLDLATLTRKVAHHAHLCIRWLRWAWEQLVYGRSEPFPEVRRRIRWQVKECIKNYPEVTCWHLIILAPCPLTDAERVQLKSAVTRELVSIKMDTKTSQVTFDEPEVRQGDPKDGWVTLLLPSSSGGVAADESLGRLVAPTLGGDPLADRRQPFRRLAQ